jgi:L-ascorbate metabolism protein UlaG (beta-lactamase superfamily)
MKIRLIRHATLLVEYAGKNILVDPMFAPKGTYAGLPAGPKHAGRNPLVELPEPPDSLGFPDIALITHLHFDHLDKTAAAWIPKETPDVCPAGDDMYVEKNGFSRVNGLDKIPVAVQGIQFTRIDGRHGRWFIRLFTGHVSGFVLKAPGEPVLYIAGDTIWCPAVAAALKTHQPGVVVVNAGAARLIIGGSITMTARHVEKVCRAVPEARIVAVHMGAVNHCRLTRGALAAALEKADLARRVAIPADGETVII